MSTEPLPDFLSDEPSSAPEPATPAPNSPEPAPEGDGAARDENGRFAPKPAATPPAPAAPAAPAPAEPQPGPVPLATFLDLRDKYAAESKRARELQAWRDQQEEQARAQPVPDRFEDPEGYEQHREAAFAQQLYEQRVEMSRAVAEVRHGSEVVQQAIQWAFARCSEDPYFNQKMKGHRDPVGAAVAEFQRDQLTSNLSPEDLDAFRAWKAQQAGDAPAGQQPAPAASSAASPRPAAPRPSLAAAPSAGAIAAPEARDGDQQFERMFG